MVNGIVFAPDGQYLVSFGRDKKLRKWSVDKGENMKAAFPMISESLKPYIVEVIITCFKDPFDLFVDNERRTNAQMCMGDKFLFVPSDTKIHVLDIETFSPVKSLGGHYNNVNCVTFNKAFQEMYSGGNDRNILVWEPNLSRTEAYHDHLAAEDKEQALSGRRRSLANTVTVDNWSSDDSD